MSLEQFAYIAEIVGVLAVVASLGYVGVQLKQNREALLAQTRQSTLVSSHTAIRTLFEHPEILSLSLDPEPLSAPDHLKIGLWYSLAMLNSETSWLQHRAGISDEAQWSTELNWLKVVTSSTPIPQMVGCRRSTIHERIVNRLRG